MQQGAAILLGLWLGVTGMAAAVTVSGTGVAHAAALKAKGQVSPEQAYDPAPAAGDVSLPMPCGMRMVFVPVEVPVQGLLWDVDFYMGAETSDRPGMEYYDRRFSQAISGPFLREDLPEAWRAALGGPATAQYYLMGKYEVSTGQWNAVMNNQCAPTAEADVLPKTEISWYDAIEFSRKYNEWLIANAANALPRFVNDTKNIGYVRLPSEAEWEYAARGGGKIAPDALRQQEFYDLAPGTTLEDYAVYRPENAARILDAPQRIGSRRANPLGLHDMAGNVAEMMLEAFHFSLGSRLHGSAGGVVRKGGSFNAGRQEIMPGRREEIPLMHERGPTRTRDTGIRLVLSGINTPDGGRTNELRKEWAALGEQSDVIAKGANPLREIDRILAQTRDTAAKENLTILRGVIKDFNIELEKEKNTSTEGLLRSSVYMLETIRNYAVRLNVSEDRIKVLEKEGEKFKDPKSEVYKMNRKLVAQYKALSVSCRDAIRASVLFYKGRLDELARTTDANVAHHMDSMKREFAGTDVFKANMTQNLTTLERHRKLARAGKGAELTPEKLTREILPDTLRVHLK